MRMPKSKPFPHSPSSTFPHTGSAAAEEHDPKITPWREEERAPPHPHPREARRGIVFWAVAAMGLMLFFYVLGFLLASGSGGENSAASDSSNTFWSFGDVIARIPIQGEISTASSSSSTGYMEIVDALKQADEDASVRAILLDIDSPGGSVVSTRQIVAQLRKTRKPVVAWIGEVGASGAYYSAAASTYIMADPHSITGSIGVVSLQPNVQELLQKIGVKMETIQAGKFKTIGSPFKELSEDERQILQTIIDDIFAQFKNDVKEFRGKKVNVQKFEEVADGRILSGKQALDAGLIDALGTKEEAIQKAAELGGISGEPQIQTFQEQHFSLADIFTQMGTQFGKGIQAGMISTPIYSSSPSSSPLEEGIKIQ